MVWREVIDALEDIRCDYERANHIISLYQDEKQRRKGAERLRGWGGVLLDLGAGPGNFTRILREYIEGIVLGLDFSVEMLRIAQKRVRGSRVEFTRGVFEILPLRSESLSGIAIIYALRDSKNIVRVLKETRRVLRPGGRLVIVDVGKPSNLFIRLLFTLYMHYIMPLLGGIVGRRGYQSPWKLLYKTYHQLPVNSELERRLKMFFKVEFSEKLFGSFILAMAERTEVKESK